MSAKGRNLYILAELVQGTMRRLLCNSDDESLNPGTHGTNEVAEMFVERP